MILAETTVIIILPQRKMQRECDRERRKWKDWFIVGTI